MEPTALALPPNILIGLGFTHILEWLKRSQHPSLAWITQTSDKLNTILSALVAALGTAGVAFSATGNIVDGMQFGLTLPGIGQLASVWLTQFLAQEVWYKKLIKK